MKSYEISDYSRTGNFEPGKLSTSTCVRGFLPSPYSKTTLSDAVFFALRNLSVPNFKVHPAACYNTHSSSLTFRHHASSI